MAIGSTPPQLLKQKLIYKGRRFDFEVSTLKLPNGAIGEWECIRHPGGTLAIPITPDGQLVLIRQYRFAACGYLLEFPAGTLEPGEDPATTIQRELQEESGYQAATWRSIGKFFLAPGYSDEIIHVFLATDLTPMATPPAQDEDEDIQVILMTPQAFEQAIYSGQVQDTRAISSYFLAKPYLP